MTTTLSHDEQDVLTCVYRDQRTPDAFHCYTEQEIQNVCNKIMASHKIRKFGCYVKLGFVRDFVVDQLQNNPSFPAVFEKHRNFKATQPTPQSNRILIGSKSVNINATIDALGNHFGIDLREIIRQTTNKKC